jgi:hypothetical protein
MHDNVFFGDCMTGGFSRRCVMSLTFPQVRTNLIGLNGSISREWTIERLLGFNFWASFHIFSSFGEKTIPLWHHHWCWMSCLLSLWHRIHVLKLVLWAREWRVAVFLGILTSAVIKICYLSEKDSHKMKLCVDPYSRNSTLQPLYAMKQSVSSPTVSCH